ncbi:MAG: DMT family transporter [Ardenticatenaceae bacterium]|nr:DMT family transporter [Ardenticatenaceae bacterium]
MELEGSETTTAAPLNTGVLLIAGAGVALGFLPILFALIPLSSTGVGIQVLSRLFVGALSLAIWNYVILPDPQVRVVPRRRDLILYAVNGLVLLLAFTTYNLSIGLGTPPAKAILLVLLHPIFTVILGRLFLGEPIGPRKIAGTLGAVAGIMVAVGFWTVSDLRAFRLGEFFALTNGLLTALVLIIGRKSSSLEHVPPLVALQFSLLAAIVWSLPIAALLAAMSIEGSQIWAFSLNGHTLLLLLALGLVGTTLPYILLYPGLQRVQASISSLLLLLEPVSVFTLQFLILGKPIFWWQIFGGTILLISNYYVQREVNGSVRRPARGR